MNAPTITRTDAEAAWEVYAAHRAQEEANPRLADDPAHVAEGRRLHAQFMEIYSGEPSSVVIPFRRKG